MAAAGRRPSDVGSCYVTHIQRQIDWGLLIAQHVLNHEAWLGHLQCAYGSFIMGKKIFRKFIAV